MREHTTSLWHPNMWILTWEKDLKVPLAAQLCQHLRMLCQMSALFECEEQDTLPKSTAPIPDWGWERPCAKYSSIPGPWPHSRLPMCFAEAELCSRSRFLWEDTWFPRADLSLQQCLKWHMLCQPWDWSSTFEQPDDNSARMRCLVCHGWGFPTWAILHHGMMICVMVWKQN